MKEEDKIAIIIGTRAELIKTFPVMIELQQKKIPYYFIHTGQHGLGDLCKQLGVKKPDVILSEEPEKSSKFNSNQLKAVQWNIVVLKKIRSELKKLKNLEYVLYHGDTMTTATASMASSRLLNPFKKYKNVHLEAGLRSFDNREPFPEEISRRIVAKFSDILLCPSINAKKNLQQYSKKFVIITGNTIIDSANLAFEESIKKNIKPLDNKFALISIHRHENIKSKERLEKIVKIISSINIPAYFTLHDNTKNKIEEFGLMSELRKNKNIKIIEPQDYISFIYQVSKCSLIICDGGSLQEESLIFKKPCIILRKATERPEGLESNFQFLSELDIEKTKRKIEEFLDENFKVEWIENPYGKIGVSKKIVEMLR